jgi:hypothetical protein
MLLNAQLRATAVNQNAPRLHNTLSQKAYERNGGKVPRSPNTDLKVRYVISSALWALQPVLSFG